MIHFFNVYISHTDLPRKFTYPFQYTPHPLCVAAAEEVKAYLSTQSQWKEELQTGKMFGVLIIKAPDGRIGYLSAFSGNLAGKNQHPFFVPPIYDLLQPQGFFKTEEEIISSINRLIRKMESDEDYLTLKNNLKEITEQAQQAVNAAKEEMKAAKEARDMQRRISPISEEESAKMIRESQFQKAELKRLKLDWESKIEKLRVKVQNFENEIEHQKRERKKRSSHLQSLLFEQFRLLNAKGEVKNIIDIFHDTAQKVPPAGSGECALPKMLQYAYQNQLKPLAMAEFWWGDSPKDEIRIHGYYYPACKGKCEPILKHMLKGLEVEKNPLENNGQSDIEPEIIYEDEYLTVINKPSGMLSVPGKNKESNSVYNWAHSRYPNATGPLIVHRLDMATSGLMMIAKTKETHIKLQKMFRDNRISKYYVAVLDGIIEPAGTEGKILLPLCPNPLDRPRQMVSEEYGKRAITEYTILKCIKQRTLVRFRPRTGRTHQLRVHSAHSLGLNTPIVGDELYGRKAEAFYLHAELLCFEHPITGKEVRCEKAASWYDEW